MARLELEAAKRARVETEQRLQREAEETESADLEAEAAALREAALRPDREKLRSVAEAIAAMGIPSVSDEAREMSIAVTRILDKAVADILAAISN